MIFQKVQTLIQNHFLNFDNIKEERKLDLNALAIWMQQQLLQNRYLNIIVICTHNSRRSHLGQILLALSSDYYKVSGINAFSGGTEATAFNYRMVNALSDVGFQINTLKDGNNPTYNITWGDSDTQRLNNIFSKPYNDKANPQEHFMAILVCDSAAQNCPVVSGAIKRVALTYRDPKEFDDTEFESKAYIEKINEMGREFFYLMSLIPIDK